MNKLLLTLFITFFAGFSSLDASAREEANQVSRSGNSSHDSSLRIQVYTNEDHSIQDVAIELRSNNVIIWVSGKSGGQLSVRKSWIQNVQDKIGSVFSVGKRLSVSPAENDSFDRSHPTFLVTSPDYDGTKL